MTDKVDILAIGAHPDDVELSCSGTLMKHIDAGYSVAIVDLTEGELGSRGTVETRYREAADAGSIIGIQNRENIQLKDGFFEETQEQLLKLIVQIRRFQPQIVLANAVSDRHPDHGRGSDFISRACFLSGLLKIETEWKGEKQEKHRPKAVYHYIQDRYIHPHLVVDITEYAERKMKSILAYKTQFYDPNSDAPKTPISGKDFMDFIQSRWRDVGRLAGYEMGEAFTVERAPGVKNLLELD